MENQIKDAKSNTSKHGTYATKICAYCGKAEGKNRKRHCDDKHEGINEEWDGKSELIGTPWCENWKETHGGARALNIHPSFKPGFKKGNNLFTKRSKAGSSVGDSSSVY